MKIFAPATVGNMAVGFDILGFALNEPGDVIEVTKIPEQTITLTLGENADSLPKDPKKNTATAGLLQLIEDLNLPFGFNVTITKGIPLCSGLGGSAASAVGAIVGANEVMHHELGDEDLLKYALIGEAQACGGVPHPDNVAPGLKGGITLCLPKRIRPIPLPKVYVVVVHPNIKISTKDARKILQPTITLKNYVAQSALLAGFIAACYENDTNLLKECMKDLIIEPQRAKLVQNFDQAKEVAKTNGAIGFSLSGSGPTVFAWIESVKKAKILERGLRECFTSKGISAKSWVTNISPNGARKI